MCRRGVKQISIHCDAVSDHKAHPGEQADPTNVWRNFIQLLPCLSLNYHLLRGGKTCCDDELQHQLH